MGDMADYYGTDRMIDDIWAEVDRIEAAETQARIEEHERMHNLRSINALTSPRVSQSLINTLGQADTWVNIHGESIPLSSIDARYASNIKAWLLRRAGAIKNGLCYWFLTAPEPGGDAASDAFDHEFQHVIDAKPEELVKESELYRALDRIGGS